MTLIPVDATSAVAVTDYLTKARDWLSTAVENSTPLGIAAAKAEISVAAEATKQLGLSKEIQTDAIEMVRRAEFALGKAIRKGQAEGTVATEHEMKRDATLIRDHLHDTQLMKPRPSEFLDGARGTSNGSGIYDMSDGVAPEEFETALDEARAEGNLSRANLVRKVKGIGNTVPQTRDARADLIVTLANSGYSIRQMPAKVGIGESAIREIVRDYNIEVPAERSVARTRRHDSTRIVAQTVTALEGLVMGVELIDYSALDETQASQWVDSLNHTMTALKRFHQKIKETTQ